MFIAAWQKELDPSKPDSRKVDISRKVIIKTEAKSSLHLFNIWLLSK